MYRIVINSIGYVKEIEFDLEYSLNVIPTTMPNEAKLFEQEEADRICNILNYENQAKNIRFSLEKIIEPKDI